MHHRGGARRRSEERRAGLTRTLRAYEKMSQIGEGTYGKVFKAISKTTGRVCAMKKIRIHHEREGLSITAIREIKVLKALSQKHNNIVELIEVVTSKGAGEDGGDDSESEEDSAKKQPNISKVFKGSIFLVLEYVDHDLSGLLDAGVKFNQLTIKCIMRQLLDVLAFMHENEYVHRDIKCSNLLMNNQHQLKLADFGLARHIRDNGGAMSNKVVTLWYRPPELLLGATKYDYAVDMWSVGCIMVELLLGRHLFPAKTEAAQIALIFKTLGTPTESSWPGHSKLPNWEAMRPQGPMQSRLAVETAGHMSMEALQLVERLLAMDPQRRLAAKTALNSTFFSSQPAAVDPLQLPPMVFKGNESFHEFETKKLRKRRAEQQKQKQQQSQQPPPPPPPPHQHQHHQQQHHHHHQQQQQQHHQYQKHHQHQAQAYGAQPVGHAPSQHQQYLHHTSDNRHQQQWSDSYGNHRSSSSSSSWAGAVEPYKKSRTQAYATSTVGGASGWRNVDSATSELMHSSLRPPQPQPQQYGTHHSARGLPPPPPPPPQGARPPLPAGYSIMPSS